MQKIFFGIVLTILLMSSRVFAQAPEENTKEEGWHRHRLTIMMANSHIPAADKVDGQNSVFIVPTWALNYDYWITKKFAVGLHTDFILQEFKLEKREDEKTIERSHPVAMNIVALFRPSEHWTFVAGGGREFEKNESFNMMCVGVEYGIELPKNWELSFNFIYDNKFKAYNSWLFGVGFSKLLGFSKKSANNRK